MARTVGTVALFKYLHLYYLCNNNKLVRGQIENVYVRNGHRFPQVKYGNSCPGTSRKARNVTSPLGNVLVECDSSQVQI